MNVNNFFVYFILPAITIVFIVVNRYYYNRKDTHEKRFNMPVDLFMGNFIASIFILVMTLGIYSYILNLGLVAEIKWEIATIYTMALLGVLIGLGAGAHIVVIHIDRLLPKENRSSDLQRTLDFYHWPFAHYLTFIPAFLIVHILVLLDLFKGNIVTLFLHHLVTLTFFAILTGFLAWIIFVITHVTRTMFYTLAIMVGSILLTLGAETITLAEHQIAYFFTIGFITAFIFLSLYRYSHHVSESVHTFIHSKFDNGDKVRDE